MEESFTDKGHRSPHSDYEQQSESNHSENEQYGLLNDRQMKRVVKSNAYWKALAIVFLSVSWILSIALTWKLSSKNLGGVYDFAKGYSTELEPLRPELEVHHVKFTGELEWDDNGTLFRPETPGVPQYVGKPSPEIDANWKALIPGEGIDLFGDEAKTVKGTTFQKPGGEYTLVVDVFHLLHCVNIIRKTIDIDYYGINEMSMETYRLHIDHCLDALRQSLMCSADITEVPVEWDDRFHRARPIFSTMTRTCRNFEKLRDWYAARDEAAHPWPTH